MNEVRVRDGRIHAERPQILTAEHYSRLLLEGFGEKASATSSNCASARGSSPSCVTAFSFAKPT